MAFQGRPALLIHRVRIPTLGGAVKADDVPTWQVVIRAAQTRTFGNVVAVGILMTGLCSIAWPNVSHRMQDREHGAEPDAVVQRLESGVPASTGAELDSPGDPASRHYGDQVATFKTLEPRATTATDPTASDAVAAGNYPDLDTALEELEQDEARKEAWAAQNGLPSVAACGLVCTSPGSGWLPPGRVPSWDPTRVDHLSSQVTGWTPQEQPNFSPAPLPDGLVPAPAGDGLGPAPGPVG